MEEDEDSHSTTTMASATSTSTTTTSMIFILLLFLSLTSLASGDDASIMIKLSRSFTPPPPGWSGPDPCKWQGVKCGSSGTVTSISLASKSLSGSLPPELSQLSSLETLSLQNNRLTGAIPPLADMSSLQRVFLDSNAFSRIPSPFLSGLTSLQVFSLDDNPLQPWSLPDSLSDSTSLQELHASNVSLQGHIPDIFGSMPSLTTLRLSYNNITGPLPASLGGSSVQYLWINNQAQGLTGTLDVLGDMPSLAQVWVQGNDFVGPVPDVSKCVSLFDIQLRDNQLTGVVPASLGTLPKLANVSLQNNMLQGPMPAFGKGVKVTLGDNNNFCNPTPGPCDPQVSALLAVAGGFGYPRELATSWKGNDACKNWVHVTCDDSGKVTVVNLAKLKWSGIISPAFANLTSLVSIILNDNDLVGTIPDALTGLKMLKKLDVSNNNLTGKVPSFGAGVQVDTDGNPFIGTNVNTSASLSPPGETNSPTELRPKSESGSGSQKSKISSYEIAGVVVAVVLLLIALAVVVYLKKRKPKVYAKIWSPNKGKKTQEEGLRMTPIYCPGGSLQDPKNGNSDNIKTYFNGDAIPIEILREVTNNFCEDNILGKGGFGVVYKGMLQDGTLIAVKRMESNLQGTKGLDEFEAEIAVLSKVRHRHLVALLGYCINGHERILVYEYMPQGTLGQHLFGIPEKGVAPLTWKQRLVIALDVARGVEYLHGLAQQSFIHRDLKPSNILLGNDMKAKVSDFGLVKNAPDQGKYSIETRLAGTFGYLAPEYAATGRVTTKVDVFAFGVVLMELITARKALDESLPDDEAQLVTWFRRMLVAKDSIRKALDPYLETHDEEVLESISKVAELAGHCTVREPHQRPDMSHAVNVLSPLVEQWRPAEHDDDDDDDSVGDMNMNLPQALRRWQAGETTTMSGYSTTDTQNYHSTAPTTPGLDDSYRSFQGR